MIMRKKKLFHLAWPLAKYVKVSKHGLILFKRKKTDCMVFSNQKLGGKMCSSCLNGFTGLFKPFSEWLQGIIYQVLEWALIWINNNPNFIFSLPMRVPTAKNSQGFQVAGKACQRAFLGVWTDHRWICEETGGIPERAWVGSGMKEWWALESGCCHLLVLWLWAKKSESQAPQL